MEIKTVQDVVAQEIASLGEVVAEGLIEHLVKLEREKRIASVIKAEELLRKLKREHNRHRPNNKLYDEGGAEVQAYFTKDALDAKNKSQENIDKLEAALNKALEGNDFDKLNDLVQKLSSKDGGKQDSAATE